MTVRVKSGEVYAGRLDHADIAVEPDYRDILLEEPALYSEESGNYLTDSTQALFIPGDQLLSIATVYDQEKDTRVIPPNEEVFSSTVGDE